jgi:NAD(P)-dependent dehydrogenase (short-subunit alcohol dehydrogenase family)
MFNLDGQVAIVTGAGTGIGEAIAQRLAAAGASVAVADIDFAAATQAASAIGKQAFAVQVDVTNASSVENAVAHVLAAKFRIDILVNNAGIGGKAAPIWEQTEDDWQKIIAINLTGPFLFCRAVLPHMRAQRYGRIVNIASIAGKEGNPRMAPYSATKAGLIGLTKSVAKEVANESICVNAVSPAVVRTKLLDQLTPAQVSYMVERIPLGRTCEPAEVAALVHFLASRDASFTTGQCYDISGGRATY